MSTLERIGIFFDPWQRDSCMAILAQNVAGLLAADIVLLSIGRQVGKTFLVGGIVFADCIVNPGTLTVWTAHRFKVARESFDELRALAESDLLAPHIDRDAITTAAGNEVLPFRNGSRIVFAARERGSIRGFRKVRRLVLDEAQILTDAALSDLAPTQNQAVNPQIILMGTPPRPSDPGEAFTRLRQEALSGEGDGLAYIEFSAEPGTDPDDRAGWATANPSFPSRTPERAIMRLRRLLNDDDFLREVMGIWALQGASAFDLVQWAALADPAAERGQRPVFAVATAPDRSWSAIAVAWRRPDSHVQVMLSDYHADATWVPSRLAELEARWGGTVVDRASQGLVEGADAASQEGVAVAEAAFADAVTAGTIRHGNEPALNVAVRSARWRPLGDTRVLDRKGSADISPVVAAALAVHGVLAPPSRPGRFISF